MTIAPPPCRPHQPDLIFIGDEPEAWFIALADPHVLSTYRQSRPQLFCRALDGRWVWEDHLGRFADGSVRPPWVDAEWKRRCAVGDPTFRESETYDLTAPDGTPFNYTKIVGEARP